MRQGARKILLEVYYLQRVSVAKQRTPKRGIFYLPAQSIWQCRSQPQKAGGSGERSHVITGTLTTSPMAMYKMRRPAALPVRCGKPSDEALPHFFRAVNNLMLLPLHTRHNSREWECVGGIYGNVTARYIWQRGPLSPPISCLWGVVLKTVIR